MNASTAVRNRSPAAIGTQARERQSLSGFELAILIVLAVLPLLSIGLRVLALPGVDNHGLDGPAALGAHLNQMLSLNDVPFEQRNHVIYLLLIPTSAIIVTLARLTLGLKVLAFRSILISVAFHQSGLIASFVLMALAIAVVQVLRPWLRHIELPKYARLSVILCTMSTLMVVVILLSPLMRRDIAWGMVAFPVIALGFLGEGIAQTTDRDHFVRAYWIAFNTILIALLMAFVYWIPALRSFVLRYPEIVLTQGIGVVLIAKFLDLRLFEHWDDRLMNTLRAREWLGARKRVAVIRNRLVPGSRSRHTLRSVQNIVDSLREARYQVKVMEGDTSLPGELRRFLPENPVTGAREGVVLNLAQGGRGDAGTTHIPAILELFGVAYAGPTPLGHAMTFDRVAFKVLLRQAGIPTPAFHLIPTKKGSELPDVTFPAVVVPRHELDSKSAIVSDAAQLQGAVRKLRRAGVEEAFIEQEVTGRSIAVSLLGNDPVECLPLVQLNAAGEKLCPAPLHEATAEHIREHARAAFRACGCRDYGRVDLRMDEGGGLWVTEVRTLGILAGQGAFARAAAEAGYSFADLMARIVEVTRKRSRRRNPPTEVMHAEDRDSQVAT
ncbi:MAG: 7TM domain-containing protein [Candidatus Eisenbacteria bacterium]